MNKKKFLSFLLAFLIMLTSFAGEAYASPGGAKNLTKSNELDGKVVGKKKVFTINKEQLKNVEDKQERPKVRTFFRSPKVTRDTVVNLTTIGLENNKNPFNWTAFPDKKFTITFSYTDTSNKKHTLKSVMFKEGETNKEFDAGWPADMDASAIQLETDFDEKYDIRVAFNKGNSVGGGGFFTFNVKVIELPNTKLEVSYQDVYGNPLTENLPEASDTMPLVKLNLGGGIEFPLAKKDIDINLRDFDRVEAQLGEGTVNALVDGMDDLALNAAGMMSISVAGNKKGDFTLGTGKDVRNYSYSVKQETAADPAKVVVTYMADVADPKPDEDGNLPATPKGYVRVTFDPTADGTFDPDKTRDLGKLKAFDVKEGLTWGQAKEKGLVIPTPQYKDGTKEWDKDGSPWRPQLPADGDSVKGQSYLAEYKEVQVPEKEKSDQPTINPIHPGDKEITGTGKPDGTIEVTLPDGSKEKTSVDQDGKWTLDLDEPAKAGDKFTARQTEDGKDSSDPVSVWVKEDNTDKGPGHSHSHSHNSGAVSSEEGPVEGSHFAYIKGYEDGTVKPEGFITRSESAQVIARLKGISQTDGSAPDFTDTPSAWYNEAINAVVKAGIMKGYPDGSFRPNANISRSEFAKMIQPIDKSNTDLAPFEDVKGHWAEDAINQAYGNGRIKGYPDGTFKPDAEISRAEAVIICNNLFDREVDAKGLEEKLKNPEDLKIFPDLEKSYWAYYEVLEASNSHDYQRRFKDLPVENWIEIYK